MNNKQQKKIDAELRNTLAKEVGTNLLELRKHTGKTQQELANATGRSVGTVHNWEQGITPITLADAAVLIGYYNITTHNGYTLDNIIDY